jgi:UDP-glucose 4-epimerase
MKVLITGILGFEGSNMALRMLEEGFKVYGLDIETSSPRKHDLPKEIQIKKGDVRNYKFIKKEVKDKDIICHLAGQVSHYRSQINPYLDLEVNCKGILNILEAIKNINKKCHLIFASSRSVYGKLRSSFKECLRNPIKETELPKPIDAYGITKLMSEYYCKLYSYHYNINTTCLRQANLFGPRQQIWTNEFQMISWIFRCIALDEEFTFMGDGTQSRDFLYIDDAIEAFIKCINNSSKVFGEIYNLGGYQYATWNEVMKICGDIFYRTPKVKFIDYTPLRKKLENSHSRLDSSKIYKAIRWKPQTDLETGFRWMKRYYSEDMIKKYLSF